MGEYVLGKNPCPRCRSNGRDSAGNNLTYYGQGNGSFCWSCGYTELSDAEKANRQEDYVYEESEVSTKELITKEENELLKGYTGIKGQNSRGISDETYKAYAVRFKYSEETGDIVETYYPYTQDYSAAGYKVRLIPKDFRSIGKIGKDSDLFGQWKWKNGGGKYVCLLAGEVDCLSAFQMLENYRKSRNSEFEPTPCVSSAIGETGSYKQVQLQYEWLNTFERIIVIYDQDDAGKKAVEKLADVLPRNKMYVVSLPVKDVNEMLEGGKEKAFINCFFKASPYTPTGVVGSSRLFDAIVEDANTEKMGFPPFMHKLNDLMPDGIALNSVGAIAASTGLGKSSVVNELCYYWIFNSPHKIGVVSMEQSAGQYGELMLSRHMKIKIGKMKSVDKKPFLQKPETLQAQKELFFNEDGSDRWMIVDDRDGDTESLKKAIEKLIIECNCKVVVIDTISDMFDGLTIDEQAVLMKWQKSIVNRYGIAIINISHQRKVGQGEKDGGQGVMGNESSLHGTSTLAKSCAWIIMLARDKMNEDEVVRNTTFVGLPKNRVAGDTGQAGAFYYCGKTHTLHDLDTWQAETGAEF